MEIQYSGGPPGFDPEKVVNCPAGFCGIGNSALPSEQRGCVYWLQTQGDVSGDSPAKQASDPGLAGGVLRQKCLYSAIVHAIRTGQTDSTSVE